MQQVMALVAVVPWGVLWLVTGALGALVVAGAGRQQVAQFAIMVAFKAARQLVGDGLLVVTDADLSTIAHAAYHALPGVVLVGPLPVPVGLLRLVLSEGAFVELVQKEYHQFRDAYEKALADQPPSPDALWSMTKPSPVRVAVEMVKGQAQMGTATLNATPTATVAQPPVADAPAVPGPAVVPALVTEAAPSVAPVGDVTQVKGG